MFVNLAGEFSSVDILADKWQTIYEHVLMKRSSQDRWSLYS